MERQMSALFGAPPPKGEKSFAAWKRKGPGYAPEKVGVVRATTKQQAERKAAILFGAGAYVTELMAA
jgi:hypothetical protein